MSRRPLTAELRTAIHAYRQLGPKRGTAAAARRLSRRGRGAVRAIALERRPLRVAPHEVRIAMGGREPAQALARAMQALPSVHRWSEELRGLSDSALASLLERADAVVAHRFDLLGSGPVELGATIDWQRDFKSGRSWPLDHISRVRISYADGSDIKLPWEISRFQHLPLLAAAGMVSGERRYLDELGAQLESWIADNPVEFGAAWACTMDVAIRAINWVAALAICAEQAAELPWLADALASLLLHGRFIRSHLEFESARGNHYLSDVVGLLIVAAPFAGSAEGQGWARWAVAELAREMRHQVRGDGCAHEASISYHRLVTELFIVGADAADALRPGELDPNVRTGIDRMLAFVADYTRPDGLAPQIGDADDGRILPLDDYGAADQRSHLHLFRQANRPYRPANRSAAYPKGGFFVLRSGDLHAVVRCGDVGIYGRGCHAHNDLTAFELSSGATVLVVDPGSYLYTADPAARNAFRATAAHSTLQLDGAEQNELRDDRLFAMVDRAHAECLGWEAGEAVTTFRGRHHGFEALPTPATLTRTLTLDGHGRSLEITDEVVSAAAHELMWSFPLAPCEVDVSGNGIIARFDKLVLRIEGDGLSASVEPGWISPRYGVRITAPIARLRGRSEPGEHRSVVLLSIVDQGPAR